MGLPAEDLPLFLRWRDNTVRPDVAPGDFDGADDPEGDRGARSATTSAPPSPSAATEPDDGLLSQIVHSTIDGEPLDETELLGISHLLILGGLDTVTATLDCMIDYLATHPDRRRELVDDPTASPPPSRSCCAGSRR